MLKKLPANTQSGKMNHGLIFVFVTLFLDIMGSTLLMPVVPYIVREYNSNAVVVGLLSATYSAAAFLAAPVLGKLSDRWGRRPVLLASVFGSAVGYAIFGLGGALWVLFISRIIDGFTGGNIATAMAYIADVTLPKDRTKNFAFGGIAFGLGFIVGPVISAALSNISLSAPAFAAGALSLASFLFGIFFLPESLPRAQRSKQALHLADVNPFKVLTELGRLANMKMLLGVVFLLNLALNGIFALIAVYTLERFAASPRDNGTLFMAVGIFQMLGQGLIVYRLTARFGEKKVTIFGTFCQGLAYLLFVFVPNFSFLYSLAVLSALGNAFARPSLDALVANSVSGEEQGRAAGATAGLYSLSNVLGPLLAGMLYDFLAPGSIFVVGGLMIVAAGAILTKVKVSQFR